MATIFIDAAGYEYVVTPDGTRFGLGLKPHGPNMLKAPRYSDKYPLIPRAQWPKKGGGLRDYFPYWWNQSENNSCCGHGSAAGANGAFNLQNQGGEPREFSPDFLYGLINGGTDQGATPDDARQAMMEKGLALKATVPHGQIYSKRYTPAMYAEASRFVVDECPVLYNFDELASAVLRKQGVSSGIWIGNRFQPDANGLVANWDGRRGGGHDMAQIGELEYIEGRGWGVWTKNSWKPWGIDGYSWIPESYFAGGMPAFKGIAVVSFKLDPSDPLPPATP